MDMKEMAALMTKISGGVDGMSAQIKTVNDNVVEVERRVATFDERVVTLEKAVKARVVSLPGVKDGKEKFSFSKLIYAISTKDWSNAGFEKELVDQATKKALSAGTTTAGGYMVPAEYIAELIPLLRAKTVTRELGATLLEGLIGSPVEIASQTGGATMYWVCENSAITDSDQTVGQLSLTPNQAAAMTKMSNRLLRLSNPSVETMVRNDIAAAMARGIDLAVLRGTGSANQPTGIANTVGINTLALGTNGATPSIDNLIDMEYALQLANADENKLGWAVHPRTFRGFRKLKDGNNQYYLTPDITDRTKSTFFGYPIKKTTQIPINLTKGSSSGVCSEIYFGNWADVVIAMWGGMEILASMETSDAFAKNQTWVRVIQDVGVGVRHAKSFCLVSDAL